MLLKDTVIVSETNQEYRIMSLVSSGTGQGDIYKVSCEGQEYALKLFYAGESDLMRQQIQVLMKRGKACPEYVHPLDILSIEGRLGYIMEYIPDTYLSGSILYNGVERDGYREELPFHVKLSVLHSLAEALSVLYNANLAMMDLKFDNLKINPNDWSIKILDTDTVVSSNDGKSLIEGTVGFMPPLTMKREETPTKYNDSYALAVIIFMSLLGSHPLMGRMGETPQKCDIETYLFAENPVYVWHPTDKRNRPTEECFITENKLRKYPKDFLVAMERTFVDGLYIKERRTTPDEWCDILQKVYESSYCCVECGEEQFFGQDSACVCDSCGLELVKPLLIVGDQRVPLFVGTSVSSCALWSSSSAEDSFVMITSTRYKGKVGLLVKVDPIKLIFSDNQIIEFTKGKVVPLFTNATYEYHNKKFIIQEG